jgi:hypothetical protein
MVAITDHEDDECPGCRFKAALAERLEWANEHGDLAWADTTGEMMVLMSNALAMLTAMRAAQVGRGGAPHAMAVAAAGSISRLGGLIDEVWHDVMSDDDGEDDDPGVGL